jgi:hypothetical protein
MNFGIDKDTNKLMFLVWFSDLKFASGFAASDVANFISTTLASRVSAIPASCNPNRYAEIDW